MRLAKATNFNQNRAKSQNWLPEPFAGASYRLVFLGDCPHLAKNLQEFQDLPDRGNDSLRKTKYIFSDKPKFFKVITPKNSFSYSIKYTKDGFSLHQINDIPKANNSL